MSLQVHKVKTSKHDVIITHFKFLAEPWCVISMGGHSSVQL